ncbi:hypothetical protein ARMGADRAFT_218999 [Armillaria gallica]|uniref:Uncharacterized protein n=1 Tax=Armillaria gallica TaxID=47427 RepID=A0A2H3D7Q2_ARMGA|nr:hypothetical protein ARMGADRAFT_218999 [Armillaria gallica]
MFLCPCGYGAFHRRSVRAIPAQAGWWPMKWSSYQSLPATAHSISRPVRRQPISKSWLKITYTEPPALVVDFSFSLFLRLSSTSEGSVKARLRA